MRLARPAGLICILFVLTFLAAAPARAEITQAELDLFVKNSSAEYTYPGDNVDVEDVFYIAARTGKTPAAAIERYAEARNISINRASHEADLIVGIFNHLATCRTGFDDSNCGLAKNPELTSQIRKVGSKDPTGQILRFAGKYFTGARRRSQSAESDIAEYLHAIGGHPAFDSIMLGLFRNDRDVEFLAPLLARRNPHPYAILELAGDVKNSRTEYGLAAIEAARDRRGPGVGTNDYYILTRALIWAYLKSGQYASGAQIYSSTPNKEQIWRAPTFWEPPWVDPDMDQAFRHLYAQLPESEKEERPKWNPEEAYSQELLSRHGWQVAHAKLNLAAAFVAIGKKGEAARLIAQLNSSELQRLGPAKRQMIYFLREVTTRKFNDDEIFRIFLNDGDDDAYEELPWIFADTLAVATGKAPGWLKVLRRSQWALRDLAFGYLLEAGYQTMARYAINEPITDQNESERGVYAFYADQLGDEFFERAAYYGSRIAEIEAERKEKVRASRKDLTPTPIHVSERPVLFEERPLPEGVAPFAPPKEGKKGGEEGRAIPEDLQLPVHPYQVVRLEKTGEEYVLIFLSQALDPVGEVSPGGYWITKSRARGHSWETPVYLGLQQFFPYLVVPKSNLPLMNGDVLQIEVQVRELDTKSITFPPIALRAKRREDGLYLRFEWSKLTQDRDSDGLTDLVEHRMGLNYDNPDTDDDGLDDGSDSLPLTAFRPREPDENELAIAILRQIMGYERAAIITGSVAPRSGEGIEDIMKSAMGPRPAIDPMHTTFMQADPAIFSGIHLPARLLVYGPDAIEKIGKEYGVFYPVSVQWVFSNRSGTKHYVIWSASWTGGAFIVRKTPEGYKTEVVSRWIT